MISYGRVRSVISPKALEITASSVFIASNIEAYEEKLEDTTITGYEYDYLGYTKDEYIRLLAEKNDSLQSELLDTQAALCDVYELLEGGLE